MKPAVSLGRTEETQDNPGEHKADGDEENSEGAGDAKKVRKAGQEDAEEPYPD